MSESPISTHKKISKADWKQHTKLLEVPPLCWFASCLRPTPPDGQEWRDWRKKWGRKAQLLTTKWVPMQFHRFFGGKLFWGFPIKLETDKSDTWAWSSDHRQFYPFLSGRGCVLKVPMASIPSDQISFSHTVEHGFMNPGGYDWVLRKSGSVTVSGCEWQLKRHTLKPGDFYSWLEGTWWQVTNDACPIKRF